MRKTPKALKKDPILEAIVEVRFESQEQALGDLLPGMLFQRLRHRFQSLSALPLAHLPKAIRDKDQSFAYQPVHALVGPGMQLRLGQRVASLSLLRPYPGWNKAEPVFREVIGSLAETRTVASITRFSLKYINLLTVGSDASDMSILKIRLEAGDFNLRAPGRHVRFEIEHRGCTHVVQVMTGADVTQTQPGSKDVRVQGVVVDVDTICFGPFGDDWALVTKLLAEAHEAEKEVFFGLLTDDTIDKMEPVYE